MSNPQTSIAYYLYIDYGFGMTRFDMRFSSELEARNYASTRQATADESFEIRSIITTETTLEAFTIPAYIPPPRSLEDIAADMSDVYAGSVDYTNDDYVRLSKADQQIVQDLMNVDDCEICGWTFQSDYLSSGDYGLVCDRCESDAEDMEQDDE